MRESKRPKLFLLHVIQARSTQILKYALTNTISQSHSETHHPNIHLSSSINLFVSVGVVDERIRRKDCSWIHHKDVVVGTNKKK